MFSSVPRIWDGGTQEKDVQLGCQSILVLHSLCPQMVGRWDCGTAVKPMTCVFFCPKNLGQWDGWTHEKDVQLGCQSILVLHSLGPQMVGRWDSGTAGKHMICDFFCPKNLGQWDGETQEKDVQLGCQSVLVLHRLCPQMVGRWDSGTAG